jgi:hypothetical protein
MNIPPTPGSQWIERLLDASINLFTLLVAVLIIGVFLSGALAAPRHPAPEMAMGRRDPGRCAPAPQSGADVGKGLAARGARTAGAKFMLSAPA